MPSIPGLRLSLQTRSDTADNMSVVAVWPVGAPWALIGHLPVLAMALMIATDTRTILGHCRTRCHKLLDCNGLGHVVRYRWAQSWQGEAGRTGCLWRAGLRGLETATTPFAERSCGG